MRLTVRKEPDKSNKAVRKRPLPYMVTRTHSRCPSGGRTRCWGWVVALAIALPTGLFGSNQTYRYVPDALRAFFETSFAPGTRLSPFDSLIQEHAMKHSMDWRLVASMIYAESRFQYDAVSPAGARGLMQIMPSVAKEHGVSVPERPEQNLQAGIGHFLWGKRKLKGRTPEDALQLSLAAYNAGLGHIRDAQKLALQLGKSPRLWKDVSAGLVLLENPEYYEKAQYGYVNGTQTVEYVGRVLKKYELYQNLYPKDPHAQARAALAVNRQDA